MTSSPLQQFRTTFESNSSPQGKLEAALNFMREALAQEGAPHFKEFWEVRRLCLPLFKEELTGPVRVEMWRQYTDLTREGRRLKDHLDADASFATEQISLAITALQEEISTPTHTDIEFPGFPKALEHNLSFYRDKQGKLSAFNAFATRINALRKELIATEMRVRQKNSFFDALSALGDRIFPPRKELILEISEVFKKDVDAFVSRHFSGEIQARLVFTYRDEIKALQAMAKVLTINTPTFTSTRTALSLCWDQLKGLEKERKKEFSMQKQLSAEQTTQLLSEIEAAKTSAEAEKRLEDIAKKMRSVSLVHQDVVALKEALQAAHAPFEELRIQKEHAAKNKRNDTILRCKEQVAALKVEAAKEDDLASLKSNFEACKAAVTELPRAERLVLEYELKDVRDLIAEREQSALCQDDAQQLCAVLVERKARRREVKAQIEHYRKLLGGSTLDFQQSIETNALMALEKKRLEKIDLSIADLTEKTHEPDSL